MTPSFVPFASMSRSRRTAALVFVGLLTVATATAAVHERAVADRLAAAHVTAEQRLRGFQSALEMTVERFRYLPTVVTQAREVRAALAAPADTDAVAAANGFLAKLEDTAGADELFVIGRDGRIVAAGNWWSTTSFVGLGFSDRPYFRRAMEHGSVRYYAVGLTTSLPGYFLSQRIEADGVALGVAVAKVGLGELEAIWWRSGEEIAMVDADGVVLLSTRPEWRYRPLETLTAEAFAAVNSPFRFGRPGVRNEGILARIEPWRGGERVRFAEDDDLGPAVVDDIRLPNYGWRLLYFTPVADATRGAGTTAAVAGLGTAGLMLLGVVGWQRRRANVATARAARLLEQRVAERTAELTDVNARLRAEMAERRRAEVGLVQAAKLASLGQAFAGIAHEISQPIAALKTSVASLKLLLERGEPEQAARRTAAMAGMVDRLSALTGHLRDFARKDTSGPVRVDPARALDEALALVGHRLEAEGVVVTVTGQELGLSVLANPIRLEQVFLNLLANALDAMAAADDRRLDIRIAAEGGEAAVTVADSGPGIPPDVLAQLFEPFFTTKEAGRGLGLGLSISAGIVGELGGRIDAASEPGAGARFTVRLPLAQPSPVGASS